MMEIGTKVRYISEPRRVGEVEGHDGIGGIGVRFAEWDDTYFSYYCFRENLEVISEEEYQKIVADERAEARKNTHEATTVGKLIKFLETLPKNARVGGDDHVTFSFSKTKPGYPDKPSPRLYVAIDH